MSRPTSAEEAQGARHAHDDGETLRRVLRQRQRHRRRSIFVRFGAALLGAVLSVVGVVVSVPVPELGLPILLLGLRLLAYEFYWAARAYARVSRLAERVLGWIRSLPRWTKRTLVFAIVVAVVAVLWATVLH